MPENKDFFEAMPPHEPHPEGRPPHEHHPRGPHPGGPPPHGPHPHGPHPDGPPPPPPPHGHHGPGRGPGPHIDPEHYAALDTNGKLFVLIGELGHASRFLLDGKSGQSRALGLLREGETMTQRELTERLGIRPGSASELVGKLERAGLITRTPSETDRRTTDIALTEAGAARREEWAGKEKNGMGELFAALSEEEKTALLALLEKLRAAWREMAPEPPAPPPPPPHGDAPPPPDTEAPPPPPEE